MHLRNLSRDPGSRGRGKDSPKEVVAVFALLALTLALALMLIDACLDRMRRVEQRVYVLELRRCKS